MSRESGEPGGLEQARWEALIDREAVGEALDEGEREFVRRYEAAHPELAREREIFEAAIGSLRSRLDAEEDPATLEREAALGSEALERFRFERDDRVKDLDGEHRGREPSPERRVAELGRARGGARPDERAPGQRAAGRGWWIAGLAAAAGLALWIGLSLRDGADETKLGAGEPVEDTSAEPDGPPPERARPRPQNPPYPATPVDPVARLSMLGAPEAPEAPGGVLELGGALEPGASLASPDRACLSWTAPGAVVCFEGELRAAAEPAAGERRLRLESGRLVAALDPLGPGQRFTIETVVGSVTAVGTVFAVELHEGRAWVTVLEGRVELRDPAVRLLSAGQRSSLRGEVPGDEPAPMEADTIPTALQELVGLAELLRATPAGVDQDQQARLLVPALGEQTLRVDGHVLAGPATLAIAPGEHVLALFAGDPSEGEGEGEPIREQAIVLEAGAVEDLRARLEPSTPSPDARTEADGASKKAPSARRLAEAAQRSREARDYDETARLYRELLRRYPDSPEAANVPVRLGDLLTATGDHQGALEAYELYLERGDRQLGPEAELGRINALRALGRAADERAAIEAFLRARPDDYRSAELKARLAELRSE